MHTATRTVCTIIVYHDVSSSPNHAQCRSLVHRHKESTTVSKEAHRKVAQNTGLKTPDMKLIFYCRIVHTAQRGHCAIYGQHPASTIYGWC